MASKNTGFTPEQLRQIAEINVQTTMQMLQQMGLIPATPPSAPVPTPTPVALTPAPVASTPAPVFTPSPALNAVELSTITTTVDTRATLEYPMTPIYGISGETLIELARRGKGDYSEMGNPIWQHIRSEILKENGLTINLLSSTDKKALGSSVTKLLGDRVSEIRRLDREAAKMAPVPTAPVAVNLPPTTSQPERVAATPIKLDMPAAYTLVLPNSPAPVFPQAAPVVEPVAEVKEEAATGNGLGPIGVKEVVKLVASAREGIKVGRSAETTLAEWAQRPGNKSRQKIAEKILIAAAAELGFKVTA